MTFPKISTNPYHAASLADSLKSQTTLHSARAGRPAPSRRRFCDPQLKTSAQLRDLSSLHVCFRDGRVELSTPVR